MMRLKPVLMALGGVALMATLLSGCTGASRFGSSRAISSPAETLPPVASSTVQSGSLPPLDGQIVVAGSDDPAAIGSPAGDPTLFDPSAQGAEAGIFPDPTLDETGSFATLGDVGVQPSAAGRDLTGGLTVSKLLGGWTLLAGSDQCRLNLTQTTKSGTNRYRASTPGCQVTGLSGIASWQLAGSQVQLFNDHGDLIGALLQSGNRFVGTLAGGVNVSMVG